MAWPLQDSDPRQLGAYRLSGRLLAESAGVVYEAHGPRGQRVSVALLSTGAAADPAARDRFTAAVAKGVGVADAPEVLSASTKKGTALWVACLGGEGKGAAGAYLAPVSVEGGAELGGGAGRGPVYRPYWELGSWGRGPGWTWQPWSGPRGAVARRADRWMIVCLLLLLLLFLILTVVLFFYLANLREQASSVPVDLEPSVSPGGEQEEDEVDPDATPDPDGEETTLDPDEEGNVPDPSPSVPEVELDPEELDDFERTEQPEQPTDIG